MARDRLFGLSEQQIAHLTAAGPSYVKSANLQRVHDLRPRYYADPINKRFPVDTPAMVWLSAIGLMKNASTIPESRRSRMAATIDKAAEIFGISDDIVALRNYRSYVSAEEPHFAVVLKTKAGGTKRLYPLRTPAEIKVAAEYFVKYRHEMPWSVRRMFATNVLARAQDVGANIANERSTLQKSACLGIAARKDVADEIRRRVRWADNTPGAEAFKGELLKLADSLEKDASVIFSSRMPDVVELLDAADRKFGWTRFYISAGVPEDNIFAVTNDDIAMLKQAVVENSYAGYMYSFDDVLRIPRESLVAALGETTVQRMSDTVGGLSAERVSMVLREPVGDLFHKVAESCGVTPIARLTKPVSLAKRARQEGLRAGRKPRRASLWDYVEKVNV